MHSLAPTHQGLERIVRASALIGRFFRSVSGAFAITQPPVAKRPHRDS